MTEESNNRKQSALLIFFIAVLFLFALFGLLFSALMWKRIGSRSGASRPVPDGDTLDLSGGVKCSGIIDYEYDDSGNLVHTYEYRERYHTGRDGEGYGAYWYLEQMKTFYYDRESRLSRVTLENSYTWNEHKRPYQWLKYDYEKDGSYTETDVGLRVSRYNEQGQVLEDENQLLYSYDDQGRLVSIRRKETPGEKLMEVHWEDETFQSLRVLYLEDGKYILWVDQCNEDWQRIAGSYYEGKLDSDPMELSVEEAELLCQPCYYGDYYQGHLMEAAEYGRVQEVDGDNRERCEYYDYDQEGRMTWSYSSFLAASIWSARQYLYDEQGRLVREIFYEGGGSREQALVDGSTIRIRKAGDRSSSWPKIVREDADGEQRHAFWLDSWYHPLYETGENGEITTYWNLTGAELLALREEEASGEKETPGAEIPGIETPPEVQPEPDFYLVKPGDCLWRIALMLWGDGNLWPRLYEANRDVIGDDPSLIYSGTELETEVFGRD